VDYVFFIFSCVFLMVSIVMFRLASGSLSILKPNLISYVFYYNILLQTFIAVVLSVLYLDGHYIIGRVGSEVRLDAWLYVMYLVIALPAGMLISKFLFDRSKSSRDLLIGYVRSPISVNFGNGNSLKFSVWIFTGLSILACLYTFWKIGYFPFVKALSSGSEDLNVVRISVSRDFGGNVYVKNVFAKAMMPILSYVWVFYYLGTRRLLDLVVASLSVIFAASILYYDFSKSPILWYVLGFVFVFFYAQGAIRLWHLVLLFILVLLGLVLMYALSGVTVSEFFSYNTGPVGRIILGQAAGLFIMIDIFPDNYNFIGFSSLSNLMSTTFGFDYVDRAARVAMAHVRPEAVESGVAGVMNSIFIAEAWANFGLVGVLISPIWVGFLLQTLYLFFLKSPKNPVYLAFFVSFSIGGSVTGGFNDYIYNPGVVLMILIFGSIMVLALFFRSFERKESRENAGL